MKMNALTIFLWFILLIFGNNRTSLCNVPRTLFSVLEPVSWAN